MGDKEFINNASPSAKISNTVTFEYYPDELLSVYFTEVSPGVVAYTHDVEINAPDNKFNNYNILVSYDDEDKIVKVEFWFLDNLSKKGISCCSQIPQEFLFLEPTYNEARNELVVYLTNIIPSDISRRARFEDIRISVVLDDDMKIIALVVDDPNNNIVSKLTENKRIECERRAIEKRRIIEEWYKNCPLLCED